MLLFNFKGVKIECHFAVVYLVMRYVPLPLSSMYIPIEQNINVIIKMSIKNMIFVKTNAAGLKTTDRDQNFNH